MIHLAKHVFHAVLGVGLAVYAASCEEGCKPVNYPDSEEYKAELKDCVARYSTKEEIDKCRESVNRKYGLCPQGDWPYVTPCGE